MELKEVRISFLTDGDTRYRTAKVSRALPATEVLHSMYDGLLGGFWLVRDELFLPEIEVRSIRLSDVDLPLKRGE